MVSSFESLVLRGGAGEGGVPIRPLTPQGLADWREGQPAPVQNWIDTVGFAAKPGELCLVPREDGTLAMALAGFAPDDHGPWALADLPRSLPEGTYRLDGPLEAGQETQIALGWALGGYGFQRYKAADRAPARLLVGDGCDFEKARRLADGVILARDLINTPANDMGPDTLADAALALAGRFDAEIDVTVGEALLEQNYPMIYAVGQASVRAPRLIDMRWGRNDATKLTLVGKGVCFDSGGLDLKGADNMRLMKKDMGGAATVLGLAHAVMDAGLDLRLRVLVPAVENSVSGNAFRPGDIFTTRSGTTVEIGNTDAEGRLVLCDALTEADQERPDLLVDMATLTGAARVALGTEVPALFTDDDRLAADLAAMAVRTDDPLWRLPLWPGYRENLTSDIADLDNAPPGRFGGAITAALFLKHFVTETKAYAHFDMMGWNLRARPGRPKGGDAFALRAVFGVIEARFA